jgi:hypothetical protein
VITTGLGDGDQVVISAIRNPIQGMAVVGIDRDDTAIANAR